MRPDYEPPSGGRPMPPLCAVQGCREIPTRTVMQWAGACAWPSMFCPQHAPPTHAEKRRAKREAKHAALRQEQG